MKLKPQIEFLLESLKAKGFDRGQIEKDLDYSEDYIDQTLSRGGNKRFLAALQRYALQKAIPTQKPEGDAESDPETIILPTGDVKRSLADYISLLEYYNTTLSNAINSGLVDIKDSLKKAESNLSQGQKNIEKQLLHSTENLGELMAKHKADLKENPPLKKGTVMGRRKDRDGDGEHKGHL